MKGIQTSDGLSVAIIGMGSRGASILERIVHFATTSAVGAVTVDIVDPHALGEGVHTTSQPDYLLLNSHCGRICMFPDAAAAPGSSRPGPTLLDWVTASGLRIASDGYSLGRSGRTVEPTDYLPRRILGEYLRWFVNQTIAAAPDSVTINIRRQTATDLAMRSDGGMLITLSDGDVLPTDYAFLTLGHIPAKPRDGRGETGRNLVSDLYPLPGSLDAVAGGADVAVEGFGLSAFDTIAALTVGRGGRFIDAGGRRAYVRSGEEPRLLLYSRTGMPFRAQPTRPAASQPYQPVVLTDAAVADISRSQDGGVDFGDSILPLLLTEMRVAYYLCRAAQDAGSDARDQWRRRLQEADGEDRFEQELARLEKAYGAFDARDLWDPSPSMATDSSRDYQRWLEAFLRDDLAEAESGLVHSPVKAALEVTGDLRGVFRTLVKRRFLTDASLELFMRDVVPLFNRAVVGPQMERQAELLALMEAGVVSAPFGPAPTVSWNDRTGTWRIRSTTLAEPFSAEVDWVCRARVDTPGLETSASPLVTALADGGVLRPRVPGSRHVPGADVDPQLHPVGTDGAVNERLWLIGPICEGSTFYNHTIPTLGGSSALIDAHRSVAELFELHERASR